MKRELAGTEVRCWDCRRMVRVPIPRSTVPVFRELMAGAREVFETRLLSAILVVAAVATGVLLIPRAGAWLELAVMIGIAAGYGSLIVEASEDEEAADDEGPRRPERRQLALQGIAVAAFGLCLWAPVVSRLLFRAGEPNPIRVTWIGALVFLVAALVLPPAMLLAFDRGARAPLGPQGVRLLVRNHPAAMVLIVVLLPLGALIAAELALLFAGSVFGWLPFLVLDLFPNPEPYCERLGIPLNKLIQLGGLPDQRYMRLYGIRLGQGYSLVGAVPPSLVVRRSNWTYAWQWTVGIEVYTYWRAGFTFLVATIFLVCLSLQARWLGILARLDPRPRMS